MMSIYASNTTLQTIYLYLIKLCLLSNSQQRYYICNFLLSKQRLLSRGFHAGSPFWFVVFLPYWILLGDYSVAKTDKLLRSIFTSPNLFSETSIVRTNCPCRLKICIDFLVFVLSTGKAIVVLPENGFGYA